MGIAILTLLAILCVFMAFRSYRQGRRIFIFWVSMAVIILVMAALLNLPANQVETIKSGDDVALNEIGTYQGIGVSAPYEVRKKNGEEVIYTVQNRGASKVQMHLNGAYAFVEAGETETMLYDIQKKDETIEIRANPEDDTTMKIRYTLKQHAVDKK